MRSEWTAQSVITALENYQAMCGDVSAGMVRFSKDPREMAAHVARMGTALETIANRKVDIDMALARLPRDERTVLTLYYVTELHSIPVVTRRLCKSPRINVSPRTVHRMWQRGIRRLVTDLCNSPAAGAQAVRLIGYRKRGSDDRESAPGQRLPGQ